VLKEQRVQGTDVPVDRQRRASLAIREGNRMLDLMKKLSLIEVKP
jgi:hypothetical protein